MSAKRSNPRFRIRLEDGAEVPIASVEALGRRIERHDVLPDTPLYDSSTDAWAPAGECPVARFIVEELVREGHLLPEEWTAEPPEPVETPTEPDEAPAEPAAPREAEADAPDPGPAAEEEASDGEVAPTDVTAETAEAAADADTPDEEAPSDVPAATGEAAADADIRLEEITIEEEPAEPEPEAPAGSELQLDDLALTEDTTEPEPEPESADADFQLEDFALQEEPVQPEAEAEAEDETSLDADAPDPAVSEEEAPAADFDLGEFTLPQEEVAEEEDQASSEGPPPEADSILDDFTLAQEEAAASRDDPDPEPDSSDPGPSMEGFTLAQEEAAPVEPGASGDRDAPGVGAPDAEGPPEGFTLSQEETQPGEDHGPPGLSTPTERPSPAPRPPASSDPWGNEAPDPGFAPSATVERPEPELREGGRRRFSLLLLALAAAVGLFADRWVGDWMGPVGAGPISGPAAEVVPGVEPLAPPPELEPLVGPALGELALRFQGTVDSLRVAAGLTEGPPGEWLGGYYFAHAGEFPEVQAFWEGYASLVDALRTRDRALFSAGLERAVDGAPADDAGDLEAYLRARYAHAEAARRARYEQLALAAATALDLHWFLEARQGDLQYTPAVGAAVPLDPVLEVGSSDEALRRELNDRLDEFFEALYRARGGGPPDPEGLEAELFPGFSAF